MSRTGRAPGRIALLVAAVATGSPALADAAGQQPRDLPAVRLDTLDTAVSAPVTQVHALPVTRLDDRPPGADIDGTPSVSLTFAEPLAVKDVLLLLFRGTPFSVVFDPGVAGTFMGELSELTVRQALEAVLSPAGLDYAVKGRVVRISAQQLETRLFGISHVDVARTWTRRVRSLSDAHETAAAINFTVSGGGDVLQQLSDGVRALLSQSGRFHVDRKAGLVQVTDFADRVAQVGVYLEALSVRANRQVRLHARVIEVSLAGPTAIDWAAVAQAAAPGVRAGSGAGIHIDDFDALMRALGGFGAVRLIAAPQAVTMNNEPAVMRVGSQHAVFGTPGAAGPADRSAAAGSGTLGVTEGLTLTIVPQIDADSVVQMSVSPTYTRRGGGVDARAGGALAVLDADTVVRVAAGETAVISGLISETVQQVGAAGIAGAFGGRERTTARTELIVLLTPVAVGPGGGSAARPQ